MILKYYTYYNWYYYIMLELLRLLGKWLYCVLYVDKVKLMLLPHGWWPMAAGPASRLGSIEPGEKTGLRLSPTPST